MKRMIIIVLLLCGVAVGMNNRPIFIKIYNAWKTGNYTIKQIADANDAQVISYAGLDPNEAKEYRKFKNLIKRNAKYKINKVIKEIRRTAIIVPDMTAIIIKLKAEGLTTKQAKAELLEVATEVLK